MELYRQMEQQSRQFLRELSANQNASTYTQCNVLGDGLRNNKQPQKSI